MIDTRVAVVVAPWASASRPSLGAGIIQASAEALGASCRTHYANVHFATVFGMDAFEAVAGDTQLFPLGEHFFAVDVFGAERLDSDRFLSGFVRGPQTPENARVTFEWDTLTVLRDMIVPAWLDEWTDRILRDDPAVVGFSCVFNQVLPSLALARRIKSLRPDIATVFGGACVHGVMGRAWSAAFPQFIDHVFLGEADVVFPQWLAAHATGGASAALPGVTVQGTIANEPVLVAALDAIPTPQFADYFAMRNELAAKGVSAGLVNAIPFESSRGCWWGAKQHCTFCGLNNEGIAFRRKSASRVVAEVGELIDRHGERRFAAADNILAHDAVTDLLPPLAAMGRGARYFYEIKANVRRDAVAAMHDAGIDHVQPGIEHFVDRVLREMRKGVSGAQNIQLLKWLAEFGIEVTWNLLVGFPGECDGDYEALLSLMPRLVHLPPPMVLHCIPVEVHRFSPFFDQPEALGIRGVRTRKELHHLVPADVADHRDISYFFDHDLDADAPLPRYRRRINEVLQSWGSADVRMHAALETDGVRITTRRGNSATSVLLGETESVTFLLADAVTSLAKLEDDVDARMPGTRRDVRRTVESLEELGALVRLHDHVVGCVPMLEPCRSAVINRWLADATQPASALRAIS